MGRIRSALAAAAFRPESLPGSLVATLALVPAVLVGLLLFRLRAFELLGVALAGGAAVHAVAVLARRPLALSPVLPALIAVALVGPAVPVWVGAALAAGAALLEVGRASIPTRPRINTGLLTYAITFVVSRGLTAAYLQPPSLRVFPEPIRLWLDFYPRAAAPIDPIRLYVGNVAGPVFATSLLAVALGGAWLWYARRLSPGVVVGMLAGALALALAYGWNPAYQLAGGPLWFATAYVLADTDLLPASRLLRVAAGVVTGVATMFTRTHGLGIEGALLSIAAAQVVIALATGARDLSRTEVFRSWIGRLPGAGPAARETGAAQAK